MSLDHDQAFARAANALSDARQPLVFTGAGMSAESGLATFRGAGGLWRGRDPMSLASPKAFADDTQLVWDFYHERRQRAFAAEPNAGHLAVTRLQQSKCFDRVNVITQNVDRLHRRAGTSDVIELHGNLDDIRCHHCAFTEDRAGEILAGIPICPTCGGPMRPGVVWFGEALPPSALSRAGEAASSCDVILVIGTSRVVYPAAAFVEVAAEAGATVIEINPEAEGRDGEITVRSSAAATLPALMDAIAT